MSQAHDLVLRGGRVMDPETGLDAVRDIGVSAGRIAEISHAPLQGAMTLDAGGLVVAPGFIDLHSHAVTPLGQHFSLHDGVTTSLELESGAFPVGSLGVHMPYEFADRALINFGASVGHAWVRERIKKGESAFSGIDDVYARAAKGQSSGGLGGSAWNDPLSADEIVKMRVLLNRGLHEGGIGIGLLLDYMSEAVSEAELLAVFEVAAERRAPVAAHIRRGLAGDPTGLVEVIEMARRTGAPLHICHVQSNAMGGIAEFLRTIRAARDGGVGVTTESYPYNAGSTSISAAVFKRDWQAIYGTTYEDVQWAATGERFTEATWHRYQEQYPNGTVIHHFNREEWSRVATLAPDVAVASDAMTPVSLETKVHPRGIGTFSRVLGRYVREEGALGLMEALAKMTVLPASVLEMAAPAFARKGRLQVDADADVTVFDPATIIDRATFEDPYQTSDGIVHVIIGGAPVIRDGGLLDGVFPGRRVRGGSG